MFKFGFYFQSASNASNSQNRVESDLDFTANTQNPLNTGYPFSNALLGVYTNYSQASTKIHQNNLYHDASWFAQDSWKISPRLTLDLGLRVSWYQPVYNTARDASFFDPALFKAADAQRLYRPVCVGAATCAAGAATYRAIDPVVQGPLTLANTLQGLYVGKVVEGWGKPTNGLGLVSQGYPSGGIDAPLLLWQPRLGFAWDVFGSRTTIVRGGGRYDI